MYSLLIGGASEQHDLDSEKNDEDSVQHGNDSEQHDEDSVQHGEGSLLFSENLVQHVSIRNSTVWIRYTTGRIRYERFLFFLK